MYRYVWLNPKSDDFKDALQVRFAVFCDEQGYTREQEVDELDSVSEHLVIYDGDRPLATGRIFEEEPGCYCIGRICVLSGLRGQQMGRRLLEALMERCRQMGARRLHIGAQCRAQGFYEKLGFVAEGEIYPDGHVPHVTMYYYFS